MPESAIGASGEAPGAAFDAQATTSEDHSRSADDRGACRQVAERSIAVVMLTLYAPLMLAIALALRLSKGRAFTFGDDDRLRFDADHGSFLSRTCIDQLPAIFTIAKGDLPLADPGFTLRTYVHLLEAGVGGGLEFPVQENAADDKERPAG